MTKPAASPELGPEVIETTRKVPRAMYPLRSLCSVGFRELVDKPKHTHWKPLFDRVDLSLGDPSYNV